MEESKRTKNHDVSRSTAILLLCSSKMIEGSEMIHLILFCGKCMKNMLFMESQSFYGKIEFRENGKFPRKANRPQQLCLHYVTAL